MAIEMTPHEGRHMSFGLMALLLAMGIVLLLSTVTGGLIVAFPALFVGGPIAIAMWLWVNQRPRQRRMAPGAHSYRMRR